MGRGREHFWEPGEDEKPELQGREESSVETRPPNRSVKLPWVAPLAGNWGMNIYLTFLSGVFPIHLLLLFSIGPTQLEARGQESP